MDAQTSFCLLETNKSIHCGYRTHYSSTLTIHWIGYPTGSQIVPSGLAKGQDHAKELCSIYDFKIVQY